MIWVAYRQFRVSAIAGLAVLAAATAYFVITGLSIHHAYAVDLAACPSQTDCGTSMSMFRNNYAPMFDLTQLLMLAAPGLIGAFWGAPLIARELETGTHQLAWNQTVTRTRWLAVKLAGVGAASIAAAGLLSYLITWWAGPLNPIAGSRFAAQTFDTRDIVPLAYAAFAFAVGTTAGLLMRRTIPAMAVTLAVFIGVQILVPTVVRPNLLPSTTVTYAVNQTTANQFGAVYVQGGDAEVHFALPVPRGAWVLSAPAVENSSSGVVSVSEHSDCFGGGAGPGADDGKGDGLDADAIAHCLAPYNLHESITYQPPGHYWPMQWIEAGIFLGAAGALSGFCFWWIRRRQS